MDLLTQNQPCRATLNPKMILGATLGFLQLGVLFATRLGQPERFSDDAHIHFRCALNWANGLGMVFNPGEWVLGTTSPCWTLLLGALYRFLGVPLPVLAAWVNFALDAGITLLALNGLRRAGLGLGSRHAVALLLNLEFRRMYFSATGMEMSLFIFTLMTALEFTQRKNWIGLGIALGLIGWIRPEGSLVWLAVAAAALIVNWGDRVKLVKMAESFGVGVILSVLVVFAMVHTYGSFLPHSMTAKALAPWFREGSGLSHVMFLIKLGDLTPLHTVTGFQAIWGPVTDNVSSILIAFVQIGLMTAGGWTLWRTGAKEIAAALAVFEVAYYLFYSILQPPIFDWYYIPYFFVSLLLSGIGWHTLIRVCVSRGIPTMPDLTRAQGPLCGGIFGLVMFAGALTLAFHGAYTGRMQGETTLDRLSFRFVPIHAHDKERMYVEVAERLRRLLPKDEANLRVACTEIGIFGFYFGGKVLDVYGLVSPEALRVAEPEVREKLPGTCLKHPLDVWMALRPELIMSDWRWVPKLPPEFDAEYARVSWKDVTVALFVRRDKAAIFSAETTGIE